MTSIIKTSSKMNAMQMVRQLWSSRFIGTNNVLLARYGNVYEARGMHNVLALEHATDVKRIKDTLRIGIPMNTIHNIAGEIKDKGYNLHVIYRGDAGAIHCHPFDSPDLRDRRSELSQMQKDKIEFEEMQRRKRISDEIKRRKTIYQEHEFYALKGEGDDSSDDDDYGVNFLNGIAIPIKNKANL